MRFFFETRLTGFDRFFPFRKKGKKFNPSLRKIFHKSLFLDTHFPPPGQDQFLRYNHRPYLRLPF